MKKNRQAFTLVEMMIVIAVIGILSGLALPAFNTIRERARQSKCFEQTSLLTRTAEVYYIEQKAYPESLESLKGYINGKSVFHCPSDGVYAPLSGSGVGPDNALIYFCSQHGCASSTWGG